jgi:hypothetical protein
MRELFGAEEGGTSEEEVVEEIVEPPVILEGWGDFKWDQTREEIEQIVSELKEVEEDYPELRQWAPPAAHYRVTATGSIKELHFWLIGDRLWKIDVYLVADVLEKVGIDHVREILREKYAQSDAVVQMLIEASVNYSSYLFGNSIVVTYSNTTIIDKEKEKYLEFFNSKPARIAREMGLEELL